MGCGTSSETEGEMENFDFATKSEAKKMGHPIEKHFKKIPTVIPIQVNELGLKDYLQIERDIAEAEIQNPLQPLDLKSEQLHQLKEKIKDLEGKAKILEKQTLSSNTSSFDAIETHKFFIENGITDELSAKQKLFLNRLNEKEINAKELKTAKKQEKHVQIEVDELEKQAQHLRGLYLKQDKLLGQIFGGEYGSLKENQIEKELDQLESQRSRILQANFKWRQGLMMLEYSCKQLAVAVQKWQDLPAIPAIDIEIRYSVAAETRNNIVAAGQNISGAQRYLENVKFPYCDATEVENLNKQAAQYIFTDMQSPERHEHAQECYTTTHQRANALLQWFDTVINTTIMKDLGDINDKVKEKTLELRRERVRLIKRKIEELYGKEVQLDQTLRGRDISAEEIATAHMTDNLVVKIGHNELDSISGIGTPPLLDDQDLAPVPTNSVIFGSMYDDYSKQLEMLADQHQEELNAFIREQQNNQNKVKGNLQAKLMERRQRRARIRVEDAQRKGLVP